MVLERRHAGCRRLRGIVRGVDEFRVGPVTHPGLAGPVPEVSTGRTCRRKLPLAGIGNLPAGTVSVIERPGLLDEIRIGPHAPLVAVRAHLAIHKKLSSRTNSRARAWWLGVTVSGNRHSEASPCPLTHVPNTWS